MAAATEVYQFEKHFNAAIASILAQTGLQVNTFPDGPIATLPRIDCIFSVEGVMDEPTQMITLSNGKSYQARYVGNAAIHISSDIATGKQAHYTQIGRVRNAFSYLQPLLISPTLPYYAVHNIHEQGSNHTLGDEQDNEVLTILNFRFIYSINPSAFDVT